MTRSIGIFLVMGCSAMMGWFPAEATDLPIATSWTKARVSFQAGAGRTCAGRDLLGNWKLVRFGSSYRFRNPQAPYLFPHQVFQYSTQGGAKSAHSLHPILGDANTVFTTVPLEMTYHVVRNGRVVLKSSGHRPLETWTCEVVTQDNVTGEGEHALQRGDLIMTLLGSGGEPLFLRHLRKSAV